ncbi:hypothetical protein BH11PSE8_BH11PSE8_24030 [soil metagenome]
MLTEAQLSKVMPNLRQAKLALYLPSLNKTMQERSVNTLLRTAAFIAQLAHESGEFRFMEELWGPTPAQVRYEPMSDLAARLGNTQPGDGKRFKGRGPIQITGRFNYQKYGGLLGIDLCADPQLAATPEVAFATAGLFWEKNGLNLLADAEDFVAITRRINGGINGLADRQMYYARARAVLADGFDAGPPAAVTRGAAREEPAAQAEPLLRGFEAIVELGAVAPPPVKKRAAKKAAAGKTAPYKKRAAKKAEPKLAVAKEGAAKKSGAKKAAARKVIAKRTATKNAPAVKIAPVKRAAARK